MKRVLFVNLIAYAADWENMAMQKTLKEVLP
jgi:hypothetical protein